MVVAITSLGDHISRYARRVRGRLASRIRALFAVANQPGVVSVAGGILSGSQPGRYTPRDPGIHFRLADDLL